MGRSKLRALAPLGWLLLGGSLLVPASLLGDDTCTSAGCHADLVAKAAVHPATESCDSCHESDGSAHPQKGKKTFALTDQPPALCFNCHDSFGNKKDVHEPVKGGECSMCHDPHSSDQPKLLTAPRTELCQTCHDDVGATAHPHGPVAAGDCTACHNPHESDNTKLLAQPGDEICYTCHADIKATMAKKNVHPAVEMGCTSCHSPHGAAHPKLLAEEGSTLCFQCHDGVAEKVQSSTVVHGAVTSAKACAACHSPHASDNEKLLLAPEKDTCVGCHPTVLTKEMTVFHGPIQEGRCTACHDPHGSANSKLLAKSFPAEVYVPYTDTAYELCFSCHKRDLLEYPDTAFATNFRDGERNLHYLHVNNAQKGRSCVLCHAVHGGSNDRLVADSVPFGQWTLPLKFVKSESGGSCAPGCHKPQSYDRKSSAKAP